MPTIQQVDRIMNHLYRGIARFTFLVFFIMLIIVLVQIFCRYILTESLTWTEETARYLSVWIVFLAIGLAFHKGELMGIDFVAKLIPERVRPLFESASHLLVLAFLFYLTKYGFILASFSMNQSAPTLRIPMGFVYGAVPVGSLIMGAFVLWSLIRLWWESAEGRVPHA